ncbi:MAG: DNA topoisomerase, partial [Polyangiales bacterium]
ADTELILDALPAMPDRYVARGRVRLVAGWQEVAGISAEGPRRSPESGDDDEDREPTALLPVLVEGEPLAGTFASVAKQTTPPPRYTEATLLGAMESAGKTIDDEALRAAMKDTGLGTPATRASIIETLLRRTYIERDQKWLVPTPTGIGLIAAIPVASLASAELTGGWEARLAAIARGADTRGAFMADIARYVTDVVDAVRGASAPRSPPPSGGAPTTHRGAPPSSSRLAAPNSAQSHSGASSSTRTANVPTSSSSSGRLAPPNRAWSLGAPLPNGSDPFRVVELPSPGAAKASVPGGDSGPGRKVRRDPARTASWASLHAAKPKPVKKPRTVAPKVAKGESPTTDVLACPRCSRGTLITGGRGWGCSRWAEGCGFVIWFETAGRRLTPTQLRDLVTKGKTRKAEFASGEGRLVLDPGITGGARFERG